MHYIVAIEPSPFRRHDSYVLGPYPRWMALMAARGAVSRHPFGAASVVPESAIVTRGDSILWPSLEPLELAIERTEAALRDLDRALEVRDA